MRAMSAAYLEEVRRPGAAPSDESATDCVASCPWRQLLYAALLTPERDDLIPELGIGSQHPVIAMAMHAWRVNE